MVQRSPEDWCCHADAVTELMLDTLMIYGEYWDAQNGTQVNVHLFFTGLPHQGVCPRPVYIQPLTAWLGWPPAKPGAHSGKGAHALLRQACEWARRRGGDGRWMETYCIFRITPPKPQRRRLVKAYLKSWVICKASFHRKKQLYCCVG